ncbi:hypothetical protein CEXT_111051 [Caerostris extrusa]|uniref:Uncharacterized protein n=1 Tax=Caerostris extrusa TaxID=172846 RepID=A0AAV4MWN2_CAEEX|nr:hypothetical protein CEXT_111051 [Caerostris extrusa]
MEVERKGLARVKMEMEFPREKLNFEATQWTPLLNPAGDGDVWRNTFLSKDGGEGRSVDVFYKPYECLADTIAAKSIENGTVGRAPKALVASSHAMQMSRLVDRALNCLL